MKDDNLKALIKEAYPVYQAPAGLFTRIKDEAESEQVILNNKRVDFSKPNPLVSKTDPESENESVVSLGLFKKTHTKKSAIITISAAAACIVLCIVTLAVTGVFSKNKNEETRPLSEASNEIPGEQTTEGNEGNILPAGQTPRVSAKMGEKETLVSASVISSSDNESDVTLVAEFPSTIIPDSSSEIVEFGRVATLSFEDETPKSCEVYVDLYLGDGRKLAHDVIPEFSWSGWRESLGVDESFGFDLPMSISSTLAEDGKSLSFPILDYYNTADLAGSKGSNITDFYYRFLVQCEFEDRNVEYSLLVHTDDSSDEILAKVVQAEPVIIVKPLTEREVFAHLGEVTLTDVSFARFINKDLESEEVENYELKQDDVILFKYNGLKPGNAFPQVIENTIVYINPLAEEFPLADVTLLDVVSSFGTVKDVVYFNLSTGVDEYATEDPARMQELFDAMSAVKVRGVYDYEVGDGTWEELGCEGDEMWQISFGYEGKDEKLILRLNPLELITGLVSDLFPEGQKSMKLVFDEDTSLSSLTVSDLATSQGLDPSSEKSPEQVLALAVNATYEVIGNDFTERKMEFDRGYSIDLNGDGSQDHIYASFAALGTDRSKDLPYGIVLVINGKLFTWDEISANGSRFVNPDRACYDLIDVSKDDAYIEIVFSDFGPSEDFSCMFYDYEEGNLNYLGEVTEDLPSSHHPNNGGIRVKGDGVIGTKKRLSLVQTWFADAECRLTDNRRIKAVEKDYYYPVTGVNVTARFDLTVYSAPDEDSELITIPAGPVSLPMTDDKHIVMVKGADGTEGYMYLADNRITTMDDEPDVTSVFDGLFLAD